jgi:hypothetical protein
MLPGKYSPWKQPFLNALPAEQKNLILNMIEDEVKI